jgi:hypothetical protein
LPTVYSTVQCCSPLCTTFSIRRVVCARCGVVRPGGFLAILCEPIGSYYAETLSAEFRGDLEDGINEQIFTDEEYAWMFATAGLVARRAVIDGGSFKAILSREDAVRSTDTTSTAPGNRPQRQVAGLRQFAGKIKRRTKRMLSGF